MCARVIDATGASYAAGERVVHRIKGAGTVAVSEMRDGRETIFVNYDSGACGYAAPEFLSPAGDTVVSIPRPFPKRERTNRKAKSAAPKNQRPMIDEVEWFDEVEPALDSLYLIKGFLDQEAMSVLYGPSNSGKTFLSLNIAYHVALGAPWRGRKVDGGAVVYLAAEGGRGIANRVAALRKMDGAINVPFALRRGGIDLLNPDADVQRIIDMADAVSKKAPLRMIVVDTLSRAMAGGDENGPVDMTAFVANIDRIRAATKAHVLVVHHSGKDAAKGARGHGSLRAATDTEIEIGVDEFGGRQATATKQREHSTGETFPFILHPVDLGIDSDGDRVSTCIVIEQEMRPADDLPSMTTCKAILNAIQVAWNKGNPFSMTPQSQRTGRYAPRALGQQFSINIGVMDKLLKSWIDNEIIIMGTFDSSNNRKGLSVIGSLE